ncbi:MAG: effector binding domain-containing protein [Lachnospiraceae bacterium]|nr:effector binding domain-containing protein [Lachnospiraceae bacterium]
MQIHFVDKADFQICGYSIETSLGESGKDVAALYNDYFNTEKAMLIDSVAKTKAADYYGLMWYLESHERYRYLVGKETVNLSVIPAEAELKKIPAALYAVASFDKDFDGVKAWTDFFFEAIPEAGYAPDYAHGFFFEYYPDGVNGNYELWTPVVKADVEK